MTIDWIGTDVSYNEAITINDYYKQHDIILIQKHYQNEFFNYDTDYQIWYGSRVSAKTWVKALQLLYKAKNQKYFRCLFTRETQKDARESQFQLFIDMIEKIYPFLQDDFEIKATEMKVICKSNGNFLKGASFENLPRSLAEYTDFWVDEPITRKSSISRNDMLDISGTLRNSYGVKTQKHLTFNPISNKTWIYTDFFESKFFEASVLLSNYQNNVFAPPEKIKELEWYKDVDYERYLVDSLGYWGTPKLDSPFITTFDSKRHISDEPLAFDRSLHTYISIDFNVDPMTALVCQVDLHKRKIRIINEFRSRDSNVYELSQWIKTNYDTRFLFITGDSSGNNRHAYSRNAKSGYQIIKDELKLNFSQIKVMKGKPANYIQNKRLIGNAVFSKHSDILLSNVPFLVEDIETISATPDGKMAKSEDPTKSHLLDCLLDFLYIIFNGDAKSIR